jgi:uncharacterized protein involved in exopolysaccharide biosynthesis
MQGGSVPTTSPKQVLLVEPAGERPSGSPTVQPSTNPNEIDLVAAFLLVWGHRYWLMLAIVLGTAAAAYLAFTTQPTFRAEVLTTEVHEQNNGVASALANQFSGLVNLSNLGAVGREEQDAEAVLDSRRLVQEFIVRNDLMAQIYPNPAARPTLWRAVTNFRKYNLAIRQDPRRGVTSLTVEWTDAAVAARWANGLVALANELIRTHALQEAQRNITYLTAQSERTTDVDLKRVIFNLIESETKTLMLANGRIEYAFRVVDPAVAPEIRAAPHRTLILITGFAVGAVGGTLLILAANWVARQRRRLRGEM